MERVVLCSQVIVYKEIFKSKSTLWDRKWLKQHTACLNVKVNYDLWNGWLWQSSLFSNNPLKWEKCEINLGIKEYRPLCPYFGDKNITGNNITGNVPFFVALSPHKKSSLPTFLTVDLAFNIWRVTVHPNGSWNCPWNYVFPSIKGLCCFSLCPSPSGEGLNPLASFNLVMYKKF